LQPQFKRFHNDACDILTLKVNMIICCELSEDKLITFLISVWAISQQCSLFGELHLHPLCFISFVNITFETPLLFDNTFIPFDLTTLGCHFILMFNDQSIS